MPLHVVHYLHYGVSVVDDSLLKYPSIPPFISSINFILKCRVLVVEWLGSTQILVVALDRGQKYDS